jgi:hypothetical protein
MLFALNNVPTTILHYILVIYIGYEYKKNTSWI